MWGQVGKCVCRAVQVGIIPTRVGTRRPQRRYVAIRRDHPHACGDKAKTYNGGSLAVGSSPRVWGQDDCFTIMPTPEGIIPTRVGTSLTQASTYRGSRDHPHACGDKQNNFRTAGRGLGSSPRVWGQGYSPFSSSTSDDIIPTRVGTR